jgi:tRNA (mo5U34)-methyltransferase
MRGGVSLFAFSRHSTSFPTLPSVDLVEQAYASLRLQDPQSHWLSRLCDLGEKALETSTHGDLPRWRAALQALPRTPGFLDGDLSAPRMGQTPGNRERLAETLMELHPWRKGPLELAGLNIDTEWRSDWKWNRIGPHLDLHGKRVLDIGCGNGYFGWRMLAEGADLVIGIDPTLVFVMQWMACRHFAGNNPNYVLPLGIEDLPLVNQDQPGGQAQFDTVFSMGVLYHRRNHREHLAQIRSLLKPGGTLVLETLVLPENYAVPVLIPETRYARMRNVWAIPSQGVLLDWLEQAAYTDLQVLDVTQTTTAEQRSTAWMRFDSLEQALDPKDSSLTREGYPAPRRAMLIARA